jgi:hypothetical protein
VATFTLNPTNYRCIPFSTMTKCDCRSSRTPHFERVCTISTYVWPVHWTSCKASSCLCFGEPEILSDFEHSGSTLDTVLGFDSPAARQEVIHRRFNHKPRCQCFFDRPEPHPIFATFCHSGCLPCERLFTTLALLLVRLLELTWDCKMILS